MNLVKTYMKKIEFEPWGPYRKVKILDSIYDQPQNKNSTALEIGKEYEVSKIKKCSGEFKCKENCTTSCYAFHVKLFEVEKDRMIEINTCGYSLGDTSGNLLNFDDNNTR